MTTEIEIAEDVNGASRRTFLRRSAVVGGSLLWVAPTVQLLDLSAKAAASTSGQQCVPTLPSCFFFLFRIDSIPHGCHDKWGTGQIMGFQWTPGVGFTAPKGTNNPLHLPGTPHYDCTSQFYREVLLALNSLKSLVTVGQTTIKVNHVNVPSYTLNLRNSFFSSVQAHGESYCGFSLTTTGASLCDFNHNNPSGWDCYLFQGDSGCGT